MKSYRILVAAGYISIFILSLLVAYTYHNEQNTLALSEEENRKASELRKNINRLNITDYRAVIAGRNRIGMERGRCRTIPSAKNGN